MLSYSASRPSKNHARFLTIWPGERESRDKLVEAQSIDLVKGRDEVRGIEAELVVSHAGVKRDDAAGGLAELNGIASCLRGSAERTASGLARMARTPLTGDRISNPSSRSSAA